MQTKDVLRGTMPTKFRIYGPNDSGRATFDWKIGRSYVLFLWYVKQHRAWELDGCGNSGPPDQAAGALKEIRRIRGGHDGFIQGVTSKPALSDPVPDVRVVARGRQGEFTATSNATGEFRIHVPAGQYTITAVRPGWSFEPADISYEDPRKIRIENGGCAQVQLVGTQMAK